MPTLSQAAQVTAMGLGVAGFILSLFNLGRDRARLRVALLRPEDLKGKKISQSWPALYIEVTNVGRRPGFVKRVGIRVRNQQTPEWHELASEGINSSLGEGDAPITRHFMLKDLRPIRQRAAIQAFAEDAKGQMLLSKPYPSEWLPGTDLIQSTANTTS